MVVSLMCISNMATLIVQVSPSSIRDKRARLTHPCETGIPPISLLEQRRHPLRSFLSFSPSQSRFAFLGLVVSSWSTTLYREAAWSPIELLDKFLDGKPFHATRFGVWFLSASFIIAQFERVEPPGFNASVSLTVSLAWIYPQTRSAQDAMKDSEIASRAVTFLRSKCELSKFSLESLRSPALADLLSYMTNIQDLSLKAIFLPHIFGVFEWLGGSELPLRYLKVLSISSLFDVDLKPVQEMIARRNSTVGTTGTGPKELHMYLCLACRETTMLKSLESLWGIDFAFGRVTIK